MQTSNRVFALVPGSLAWPKTLADRGGNGAISRHLIYRVIYRAIYILTQLAAPGVRRGINPPARPGDYRRGHQRYRHQISRGRQRRIPEDSAARLPERNFQDMLENRLPGERPDRYPAAGTWERTSPRFRRDRSRRDAAGADFPGYAENRLPGELNCLPRWITAGWRSTIDGC